MSTSILQALLKLFAIISGDSKTDGSQVVSLFLGNRLSQQQLASFLDDYKRYVAQYHKPRASSEKQLAMTSVKVLRLCEEIQSSLNQHERYLVFVRLVEFVFATKEHSAQDLEFLDTVGEAFHLNQKTRFAIVHFVHSKDLESSDYFYILEGIKAGTHDHLPSGKLMFLRIPEENLFYFRYIGTDELFINGAAVMPNSVYAFFSGSSIRGSRIRTIFYSDVLRAFLTQEDLIAIDFRCLNVSHRFANKKAALETLNFSASSGELVGIMGGSGSGKSTLLNVLNGNTKPTYGNVTINGKSIFDRKTGLRDIMGYISQDDILIEELTVYQNLFYNAQLLFRDKTKEELEVMVAKTLQDVGLTECKDLRVGNVLDKTISGGQRKRLHIALELIRKPAVLFVDEPTSGLSSRDSENIMDLLKELTLGGKLIFVVIHQPSSDIFNLFDKLLLLDQGGMPIYYGDPIESILYFKRLVNQVNIEESRCPRCGNVNPEQLFNIIEAKVLDEYGHETQQRKVSASEWNHFFNLFGNSSLREGASMSNHIEVEAIKKPRAFKQFGIFLRRDILGKITNKQYLLINLLEAPLLGFILSWFIKYGSKDEYIFKENVNFPQYIFIAVVVALFMGLTVSAEEIIRDRKLLKRERYLNLNKQSYLFSKIALMFFISAVQTASYVAVGNSILEVKGMFLPFWGILFSTACFANVLGLNISATFNSAKVIYILIPILIIPQLLFSGVIVRFDRLNKYMMEEGKVSWIGDMMASRWAYEAMAVYQYTNNDFNARIFETDLQLKTFGWEKDFWIVEMRNQINSWENNQDGESLALVTHEMAERTKECPEFLVALDNIRNASFASADTCLWALNKYEIRTIDKFNYLNDVKDKWVSKQMNGDENAKAYLKGVNDYTNESLEEFVTAKNDLKKLVIANGELIRKANPIYNLPKEGIGFFDSHFYAPRKNFFNTMIDTPTGNMLVIWSMTIVFVLFLLFDILKESFNWAEVQWSKLTGKRIAKK